MIDDYNYHNAPKYKVNITKMIKLHLFHEHICINKWQSLSPDFDTSVIIFIVLSIITLPPDFRNFKALYLSNSTFSRYGINCINFASLFKCYLEMCSEIIFDEADFFRP